MKKSGKKTILLCSMFLLFALSAAGQEIKFESANFSVGKIGTKNYEHFTFWVAGGRAEKIVYWHGKGVANEIELTFLGLETKGKLKGLKVRFPNNSILIIMPSGGTLKVTNQQGTYRKIFSWEYEGARNGIGTGCNDCPQNAEGAIKFVKTYFLK